MVTGATRKYHAKRRDWPSYDVLLWTTHARHCSGSPVIEIVGSHDRREGGKRRGQFEAGMRWREDGGQSGDMYTDTDGIRDAN